MFVKFGTSSYDHNRVGRGSDESKDLVVVELNQVIQFFDLGRVGLFAKWADDCKTYNNSRLTSLRFLMIDNTDLVCAVTGLSNLFVIKSSSKRKIVQNIQIGSDPEFHFNFGLGSGLGDKSCWSGWVQWVEFKEID